MCIIYVYEYIYMYMYIQMVTLHNYTCVQHVYVTCNKYMCAIISTYVCNYTHINIYIHVHVHIYITHTNYNTIQYIAHRLTGLGPG